MTPKEALENVKHEIQQRLNDMVVDGCDLGSVLAIESFIRSNLEVIEKALTEFEALKRYPTSDEVCKALSEDYDREVLYDTEARTFYYEEMRYERENITTFGLYGFLINKYLPPHLITLIGRFYESINNKEN